MPVLALDEVYGTVCFVSETPREEPFNEEESRFAKLLGHLLGQAIERELHEAQLSEREEMINVLCRVLRHNLHNDLTIIQGHTELVQTQHSEATEAHAETITETINELFELTERTRQLSSLVTESFDRRELDVEGLVRDLATKVEADYPEATVTVEGVSGTQIKASPQLEQAVRELLENAAKHTEESPSVTISLSSTDEMVQIRVADNGPGLPKQERTVLKEGAETALEHSSGLGLWVVYWIVTRHEGHIKTSISETGTTVMIALPYGPAKISTTEEPSPSEQT